MSNTGFQELMKLSHAGLQEFLLFRGYEPEHDGMSLRELLCV